MPSALQSRRNAPGSIDIAGRRGTGYIWLAYSLFFFIDPVVRHNTTFWLQCIAGYLVFLAAYVTYIQTSSIRLRQFLLGFFYLLGLLTYPHNSGASSFFVYAAAFLPFVITSTSRFILIVIAECIGLLAEGFYLHLNPYSVTATFFFILVVGSANFFIAQQKRADARLRRAQEENVTLAALAERERIARDLHDVLGHTLSLIVLKSELAGRLIAIDPDRARLEMADVEKTARTALAEVREAIGGYRSQGLPAELELARNTLSAAGVALACDSPIPRLSAAEETVLALALREAVTNIVRHAHATACTLRFAVTQDGYHSLLVEDNGPNPIQREGNGLRGMRERVLSVGGRLSISNHNGTALLIELPPTPNTNNLSSFAKGGQPASALPSDRACITQ